MTLNEKFYLNNDSSFIPSKVYGNLDYIKENMSKTFFAKIIIIFKNPSLIFKQFPES